MRNSEENRSRRLIIRFKPEEFKLIEAQFKKTNFRKMSEFSRDVLLERKITVIYRNQSLDEILEELIHLRKELNHAGVNFNQAVKKLNSVSGMPDAPVWQSMLIVLRDQLEPSIREIKERVHAYSDIWSQRLLTERV